MRKVERHTSTRQCAYLTICTGRAEFVNDASGSGADQAVAHQPGTQRAGDEQVRVSLVGDSGDLVDGTGRRRLVYHVDW